MHTLIARDGGIAGDGVGNGGTDERWDNEGVASGSFGDEDYGCERSFVCRRDERRHAHCGVELVRAGVHDRLREGDAESAAGEEERDEHGADAAGSERECSCREFEGAECQQLSGGVAAVENLADSFVVGADGDERTGIELQEEKPAEAGEKAAERELDPVRSGPLHHETAETAEADDEGHRNQADEHTEHGTPEEIAHGVRTGAGEVEERSRAEERAHGDVGDHRGDQRGEKGFVREIVFIRHLKREDDAGERSTKHSGHARSGPADEHDATIARLQPEATHTSKMRPEPGSDRGSAIDAGAFERGAAAEADRGHGSQQLCWERSHVDAPLMLVVGTDDLFGGVLVWVCGEELHDETGESHSRAQGPELWPSDAADNRP